MKILAISNLPLNNYQGSGKTRTGWTTGLRALGHEVDVLQPSDFELMPFLGKGKRIRLTAGALLKGMAKALRKDYDVLEFYGDSYWMLLPLLKTFKRKRPLIVAHADGLELNDAIKEQTYWNTRAGIKKWIYYDLNYRLAKINFSIADAFVCNCEDDRNFAIDHDLFTPKNARCIQPGIDDQFHHYQFRPQKEKFIVYIGTWIGRKSVGVIPPVISAVLRCHPDYQFHVYGAWDAIETIENAFDPAIRPRVKVHGKVSTAQLLDGCRRASIFFFPSYSEGLPLASVEAMSCSCAIVTTPTGLGSNLVAGKEALICPFNDVDGMISAINALIEDEAFRLEIAYNGFVRSKEFVWSDQVKKLEQYYLQLAGNRN